MFKKLRCVSFISAAFVVTFLSGVSTMAAPTTSTPGAVTAAPGKAGDGKSATSAGNSATTSSPASAKGGMEKATFAAGCFWGTEEFFRKLPGVMDTEVGYAGGTPKVNYEDVKTGKTGNAESVELTYDPKKISYKELLTLFFKMHDPTTLNRQGNDVGTQYRSAIFYHTDKQKADAMEVMKQIEKSGAWKSKLTTEVAPAGKFDKAEPEHQKYLVNNPGGYDNHHMRNISFGLPEEKEASQLYEKSQQKN